MTGNGVMTYNGGEVYRGDFKDGKRSGRGILTDAEGNTIYDGIWNDDNKVIL